MSDRPPRERLAHKANRQFQGYPVGTIAWYGPDNRRATKAVIGVVRKEGAPVDPMEKWFSDDMDVRDDPTIGAAMLAFLQSHGVRSVVMSDGLLGCPHEEGIDYALGGICPVCPYWAGRERPI